MDGGELSCWCSSNIAIIVSSSFVRTAKDCCSKNRLLQMVLIVYERETCFGDAVVEWLVCV